MKRAVFSVAAAAHSGLSLSVPRAKGGASVVGPKIAQQLEAQLGYCPLNALDVVTTTDDAPAVVIAHPLLHRKKGVEPFPTTYWLAHNGIAAAVATVERDGGVSAAGAAVDTGLAVLPEGTGTISGTRSKPDEAQELAES